MALNCVTNVCADIHVAIPTMVMLEMLPVGILTFNEFHSLLWILCRSFHSAIHSVYLFFRGTTITTFHFFLIFMYMCICNYQYITSTQDEVSLSKTLQ